MSDIQPTEADREEAIRILDGSYECTRVWSAWSYGTMSEDDFGLSAEDENRVDDTAKAIARIRADAVKAERGRDIAGEVWDILVPYIRPADKHRSVTSVYDEMREHFSIPTALSDDREAHRG